MTTIGTVNLHLPPNTIGYRPSEVREIALEALRHAMDSVSNGLMSITIFENHTRIFFGGVEFSVFGASLYPVGTHSVWGECAVCGTDWDESRDYCASCESDS